MSFSFPLIILLSVFFAPLVNAQSVDTVLANGLKLIVVEDHRAPVAISQIWYRVGSSYETDGTTGVSHALEHLMFKATKNFPAGEFSRVVAEYGGYDNAFTGKHYTAYVQRVASDRLESCLKYESDRMRNLLFQQEEFVREIEVIKEERNLRIENSPHARLYERFIARAFERSPVRIPIIGSNQDLDKLKLGDTAEWYRRWYAPNNATLVVVGYVSTSEITALVEKYFGDIKPASIEATAVVAEPRQEGLRKVSLRANTSSSYLLMGYKVPVLKNLDDPSDAYALDLLSGILDGGNSARFTRYLQREQGVAISASAGYDPFDRLQGLFILSGVPRQGVTIDQLQQAITDQIDILKRELVSDDELERVKTQNLAGRTYAQDSMFNIAMQIGMLDSAGHDWRLKDRYIDSIDRVTAQDIKRVARRYFIQESLTLGVLSPIDSKQPANSKAQ